MTLLLQENQDETELQLTAINNLQWILSLVLWGLSPSLFRYRDEICVWFFVCVHRLSPSCYHGVPLKCNIGTARERILDLESNPAHQLLIAQASPIRLLLRQRY